MKNDKKHRLKYFTLINDKFLFHPRWTKLLRRGFFVFLGNLHDAETKVSICLPPTNIWTNIYVGNFMSFFFHLIQLRQWSWTMTMIYRNFNLFGLRKLFFVFCFLIFLSTLLLRQILESLYDFHPDVPRPLSEESFLDLDNFLTSQDQPLENGQNIFFLDSTRMKRHNKKRSFTARQACAVESSGKKFNSSRALLVFSNLF